MSDTGLTPKMAASSAPTPASTGVTEHRLFIGGLPSTTTDAEMASRFGKFGTVVSVRLAPVTDAADPTGA